MAALLLQDGEDAAKEVQIIVEESGE